MPATATRLAKKVGFGIATRELKNELRETKQEAARLRLQARILHHESAMLCEASRQLLQSIDKSTPA